MADREDNVYKAKLAEQAERYDGILSANVLLLFLMETLPVAGLSSPPDLWQRHVSSC